MNTEIKSFLMENKTTMPPVAIFGQLLDLAVEKFKISYTQAREKHGMLLCGEWLILLFGDTRTITVSSQEFSTILRALGIAENTFNKLRKHYIDNVVRVRGVASTNDAISEADVMVARENEAGDLLADLMSGKRDYKP